MASYLTVAQWRLRTTMPAGSVDVLEAERPGYLQAALDDRAQEFHEILNRRYDVPFDMSSPPRTLLRWITHAVTFDAYNALGYDASALQDKTIEERAEAALTQAREAANSVTGLYELPLRASTENVTGITKGGPFSYSEPGPYDWLDEQREATRGRSR